MTRCNWLVRALAAAMLGVPGAMGGAEPPLDLAAVMEQARLASWDVAGADARLRARQADLERARAERWPRLRLVEAWTRTDAPADAFGLSLMQEQFSFQDFVAGDPNDPGSIEDAMTRFELEVPLLTGGESSARIAQAAAAQAAAGAISQRSSDQAAAAAAIAWVRLAEAREAVAMLERALATVEAHVRFAAAHVEAGTLVASELLRAEVERARVADLLAEARGFEGVAAAELVFRLGGWESARNAALAEIPPPPDLDAAHDQLLGGIPSRADLEAARHGQSALALGVDVARALRRPKVGLVVRRDLHDQDLFGASGDSTTIAVLASLDLFDGGRARAAVAAAKAEADAGRADTTRAEHAAQLQAEAAWVRLTSARDRAHTALEALRAAREVARIVEARYQQGIVRTLDVLDAATALRESETRELSARAAAWEATFDLALAVGRPPEELLAASTIRTKASD